MIGRITKTNKYGYKIVVPTREKCILYAARELRDFIRKSCGAQLEIEIFGGFAENRIFLGCREIPKDCGNLNYDGFLIKSENSSVYIDAYRSTGILNGVYSFCEKVLHIGFYTPLSVRIPQRRAIDIPFLDGKEIPSFSIREFACEAEDEDPVFAARMRLRSTCFDYGGDFGGGGTYEYANPPVNESGPCRNNEASIYRKQGNNWRCGSGHTLNSFVPNTEENLKNHPEWFADEKGLAVCYMNGLTDDGDADDSNPDSNLAEAIKQAKLFIDRKPSARLLMFGHNDTDKMCTCGRCRAAREKFGGFSGVQMLFVNALASALADYRKEKGYDGEFYVCAFAYWPSWKAPVVSDGKGGYLPAQEKTIARNDVCIKLAHMTCMHHGLFRKCRLNEESGFFIENIRAWQAVCRHFAVWEYNTNFSHFLWWLDSFDIIRRQYALYKELDTIHILSQGGINSYANALKLYVYSKSMWDFRSDPMRAIRAFNKGVFGKYRGVADRFVSAMNGNKKRLDKLMHAGFCSAIYEGDISGFFSAENYPKELLCGQIKEIRETIAKIGENEPPAERERLQRELTSMLVIPEYMVFKNYESYFSGGKKAFVKEFAEHLRFIGLKSFGEGDYGGIEKALSE